MQYAVGYRTAEGDRYVYVCIGWREYDYTGKDLEMAIRRVMAVDFGLRNPSLEIFYIARRQYA
jgi:hypothetical protein